MDKANIAKKYDQEIDWNIACLCTNSETAFFQILESMRQANYRLPNIKSVFGAPVSVLSGGRCLSDQKVHPDEFKKRVRAYGDFGIGCRLTFQSTDVTKEDLEDPYCNSLLQILAENNKNGSNGVILCSDELAEYIRKNYPSLLLVSSLVKPAIEVGLIKDSPEYYNELLKRFDIVVVGTSRALEDGFMDKIDEPGRVEIIANSRCIRNCPMAGTHYKQISEVSKYMAKDQNFTHRDVPTFDFIPEQRCNPIKDSDGGRAMLMLDDDDINYLISKGVRHFKLEGREYSQISMMLDIGRYMFNSNYYRVVHFV